MTTTTKPKQNTPQIAVVKPIDPKKVKKGDLMAMLTYVTVTKSESNGAYLHVKNLDNGMDFRVDGADLVKDMKSGDQFADERMVTMTEAAEMLSTSYNTPFTVVFTKQKGEVRTLRGRLVKPEPLLGRSYVEDLDIDVSQHRVRLVDHREIISFTVNNIKYTVK